MCLCLSIHGYVHINLIMKAKKRHGSPVAGITGGSEPTDIGAGN